MTLAGAPHRLRHSLLSRVVILIIAFAGSAESSDECFLVSENPLELSISIEDPVAFFGLGCIEVLEELEQKMPIYGEISSAQASAVPLGGGTASAMADPVAVIPEAIWGVTGNEIPGISPDGLQFVAGSNANACSIFDASTGSILSTVVDGTGTAALMTCLAISNTNLAVGSAISLSPLTFHGVIADFSGGTLDLVDGTAGTYEVSNFQGISANGAVMVGNAIEFPAVQGSAFSLSGGTIVPIDFDGQADDTFARGLSNDGRWVVGNLNQPAPSAGSTAYRYDLSAPPATALEIIGHLPGGTFSVALDVSDDGSIVVGTSSVGGDEIPFKWEEGVGLTALGVLAEPGCAAFVNEAVAVSADGSIAVGTNCNGIAVAYKFDSATPTVPIDLEAVVSAAGAMPADLGAFTSARGISDDGTRIVAKAENMAGIEGTVIIENAVAVAVPDLSLMLIVGTAGLAEMSRRRKRHIEKPNRFT